MSNEIVLTPTERQGRYDEGVLGGSASMKPGQFISQTTTAGSWQPWTGGGDGHRYGTALLVPNHLIGRTTNDAYAVGDHIFFYYPQPGDWIRCLILDVAGTGDVYTIGGKFIIINGTGKVKATTGSPESEPLTLDEAITTAPTGDLLARFLYTGF